MGSIFFEEESLTAESAPKYESKKHEVKPDNSNQERDNKTRQILDQDHRSALQTSQQPTPQREWRYQVTWKILGWKEVEEAYPQLWPMSMELKQIMTLG